jgi:membrane protease YdiL (CAAX protease family)
VYTENSPQVTPLEEERADPPSTVLCDEVQAPQIPEKPQWWLPWIDVAIAVGIWFASVLMLAFVPVFVALPYVIYRLVKVGASAAQAVVIDPISLFFTVLGILPAHLLTLLLIWLVFRAFRTNAEESFWKNIGFEWPKSMSPSVTTVVCVLLALVLFGLAQLVTYIYGERKTDLDLLIESSIYTRLATAFIATATAPLIEELIYRGVLYQALEKAAGVAITVPVVTLLFSGVHVYQYRNNVAVILVITLLSLVLTLSRALTGKVLPAFLIHLAFNGIQSVFIVLGAFVNTDPVK